MRPVALFSLAALAALLLALPGGAQGTGTGGGPETGKQEFKRNLDVLGFDTLGTPSTGLNAEIVVDFDADVAYVGNLNFDDDEFGEDFTFKVVDVSNPRDPEMIAAIPVFQNFLGNFDIKIAGHVLAASGHTGPQAGVSVFDRSDPRNPVFASHIDGTQTGSVIGSHNSFLWEDPLTTRIWLFVTGMAPGSLDLFDVTNPFSPVHWSSYDSTAVPGQHGAFVHDNWVQENGGRVFNYQVGSIGFEILDVTRVVRGPAGPLTDADVVGANYYTAGVEGFPPVTRPKFSHYVEPTADGTVSWVGDEVGCGDEPGIIHAFDTAVLPPPGTKKPLEEIGVLIENPDAPTCQGESDNAQTNQYRWTGHNFDIIGNELLVRGDYGRGVYVYDITDPSDAGWVAFAKGQLNLGVGAENKADPGRDKTLENYPFIWQAIMDPATNIIYASDINQGIYTLRLQPAK